MKPGFASGSGRNVTPAIEIAIAAWGGGARDKVPDWVLVFSQMCDTHSRGHVAARLGYSPPVVSQVLNGTYKGDIGRIAEMVRGAFMASKVDCPVNGETPLDVCLADQKRSPPFASSWRMQVYRACRAGCPNYRGAK